jgi:polyamine oxidase
MKNSPVDVSRRSLLLAGSASLASALAPRFRAKADTAKVTSAGSKLIKSAVVIGSGVSGLGAATRLKEAGVEVTVIEASGRVGGRVLTDNSLGVPIDLGASWLIGKNPVYRMLKNQNTKLSLPSDFDSVDLFAANGSRISTAEVLGATVRMRYIDRMVRRWNKHHETDVSVGKVLDRYGAVDGSSGIGRNVVDYFLNLALTLDYAAGADQFSARQYGTYTTQYGSEERFVPGGMSQVVTLMSSRLDIRLNTEVDSIEVTAAGVLVSAGAERFSADLCVVTVPLGVLKQRQIQFSPTFPDALLGSIDLLGVGSFFKLAMRFDSPFWNLDREFIGSVGNAQRFGGGEHVTFVNLSEVVGAPVLVMFLGSPYAEQFERGSLRSSTEFAVSRLRSIFGNRVPLPASVVRSDWTTSRYSGGAYSFYGVGSTPESIAQFHKVYQGRLTFAGEHTSATNFGTVHGAYDSGLAAADRILSAKSSSR